MRVELTFRDRPCIAEGYLEGADEFWVESLEYADGEEVDMASVTTTEWHEINDKCLPQAKAEALPNYEDGDFTPARFDENGDEA